MKTQPKNTIRLLDASSRLKTTVFESPRVPRVFLELLNIEWRSTIFSFILLGSRVYMCHFKPICGLEFVT
jgi:hypothetical protein